MKAPEKYSSSPENGVRSINYSMLPPGKLPKWLLEKKAPEKIYNFSMRPPGSSERLPAPILEEPNNEPVAIFFPPLAPLPPTTQPMASLDEVFNTVELEDSALAPEPLVSSAIHHALEPESPVPASQEPIILPVESPATQDWQQPPAIPAAPHQQQPAQVSRPEGFSLGDWIYKNSTTAIVIVVVAIALEVLIVVLMELGFI